MRESIQGMRGGARESRGGGKEFGNKERRRVINGQFLGRRKKDIKKEKDE